MRNFTLFRHSPMCRSLLAAILAGTTCTASGQSIKVIETVTDAQGNT